MNIELAQELKEAGFPQEWRLGSAFYCENELYYIGDVESLSEWKDNPDGSGYHTASNSGCGCCSFGVGSSVNEYTYVPTLEELIEACGEEFKALENTNLVYGNINENERWFATSSYKRNLSYVGGIGKTPEEAVARLWLALNK